MSYRCEINGTTAHFFLEQSLSLEQLAKLRVLLWEALDKQHCLTLLLDLNLLTVLDPSTISLLVSTKNLADKYKASMRLVGLNQACTDILEQTSLLDYFEIASNQDPSTGDEAV